MNFGTNFSRFEHENIENCADYCFNILSKMSLPIKFQNFIKNASILNSFDNQQRQQKLWTTNDHKPNQNVGLSLKRFKKYVVSQICLTPCFIATREEDRSVGPKFLKELVKISLKNGSSVSINTKLGHLKSMTAECPNSNLQIINLNHVSPNFSIDQQKSTIENANQFEQILVTI